MRQKSLALWTIILVGVGLNHLKAQEVVPASGGTAGGIGGSAGYSIGQVVYTTIAGDFVSVAQGVQQGYDISVVSAVEGTGNIDLMIMAYPNPVSDHLTLKIGDSDPGIYSYQLFDLQGKLLESKNIIGDETIIAMNNFPPATYFLKIARTHRESHDGRSDEASARQSIPIKTFKIVKN